MEETPHLFKKRTYFVYVRCFTVKKIPNKQIVFVKWVAFLHEKKKKERH